MDFSLRLTRLLKVKQPGELSEARAKEIAKTFLDAGLEIPLIGSYFNPVHSNKELVKRNISKFKMHLDYSHFFNTKYIGSETGSYNDDKWTYNPLNRTEEAFEIVKNTFKELAIYAKEVNSNLSIEGADGHCMYCPKQLKRLVDSIDNGHVFVTVDVYNYLNEQNYLEQNKGEKSKHHLFCRIAMQGISGVDDKQRLIATIIPAGYYLANSCNYIIRTNDYDLKYILSIFNSCLMNWVFKRTSTNSNVNCYEVELMPFKFNKNYNLILSKMVKKILFITNSDDYQQNKEKQDVVKEYEKQIDIMVYKLYDLTYDEVLTIDKEFTLSEQEYNTFKI